MKKQETKKIQLGTYPYTYVRTVVMRTLLFKKEDYQKMLKMSFSEIARYLQDSQYRSEIDKLAPLYRGAALVEQALNRNMAHMLTKLKRISPEELGKLIGIYLKRYDVYNLKTLFRARFTKADENALDALLIPAGELDRQKLKELFHKNSEEAILRESKLLPFKEAERALQRFQHVHPASYGCQKRRGDIGHGGKEVSGCKGSC
ncbi:V-type ATPase subunit [Candidatus Woesearchaeota archaeon]|nr:V-type ATPase subunit [Candidatus Woesearchaeota archaeon]